MKANGISAKVHPVHEGSVIETAFHRRAHLLWNRLIVLKHCLPREWVTFPLDGGKTAWTPKSVTVAVAIITPISGKTEHFLHFFLPFVGAMQESDSH
jgi:hypothetical protein